MIGDAFQIHHVFKIPDQQSLSGSGSAANDNRRAGNQLGIELPHQIGSERFIATLKAGNLTADRLFGPLLRKLRTQSAPEAIDERIGMAHHEINPRGDPLLLDRPANQFVPQCNRGGLPLLLVADTDQTPLFVIHQRQIDGRRERARSELDRRTHINQRNVFHHQSMKVVYGPRHQMKHSRQGFLNWFVRMAFNNEEIQIYGEGKQLRDFNHVRDVVKAFLLAAASDKVNGQVFNLGSGCPISIVDVTKLIVKMVGAGSLRHIDFPLDKLSIEVGDYYADFSKIKNALGWEPETNLDDGLKETIDFYHRFGKYYW